MPQRPVTAEDLWNMPRVGGPVPSPDGSKVLVPVSTYSMEANEGTTRIWLIPGDATGAGGKEGRGTDPARPLTTAEASSGQPAWDPEGTRFLFVRKPGGVKDEKKKQLPKFPDKPQIYLLSLDGGEAERLTDFPLGVSDPLWFPDAKRIAFLAAVYADAPSLEETAKKAKAKEEDPVKAAVTEDRVYRYWDRWLTDGTVHHLFVLDLETREIVDLIPDSKRVFDPDDPSGQYRISPDGREIVFSACRTLPPHDPWLWGAFTVEVPGRIRAGAKPPRVREITPKEAANISRPIYSPDGDHIIMGLQREWDFYADKVRILAYDRRRERSDVLTEPWDVSPSCWDFGEDDPYLYLTADAEGRTAFYRLDFRAALRKPGKVLPEEVLRGGSLSDPRPAGGLLFANRSTLTEPPEVVAYTKDGKRMRTLTAFTEPHLRDLELSEATEECFIGAEGRRIQMFLVYPPGVKAPKSTGGKIATARRTGKAFPLVHMIHGGPHGAFPDQWHWRWNAQTFAAPGYLVALVNFHGSTGWGQDFTASILGRWGDQPYKDIMAATDSLIERGLADPSRMAVSGGSYGGYLVSWIAGQTDRFACIVNHAGVCDFQTQYASDVTQGRPRSLGGEPWDNIEGMDRYNPLRHAAGFRSPMLVIHGEKDYRVPYNQGLEIYNVYKAMKLPARLVVYPDENHWILKPRNSRHWYGEVLAWLERWIGKGRK